MNVVFFYFCFFFVFTFAAAATQQQFHSAEAALSALVQSSARERLCVRVCVRRAHKNHWNVECGIH